MFVFPAVVPTKYTKWQISKIIKKRGNWQLKRLTFKWFSGIIRSVQRHKVTHKKQGDDEMNINKIAKMANVSTQEAEDIINADWPNAEEHAEWLRSASDEEISEWVAQMVE